MIDKASIRFFSDFAKVHPETDLSQRSSHYSYGHFCRPGLGRLLESVGLDVSYERAEGDFLWYRRGGQLIPVLDLVGGYGANLYGHNHPELVDVACRHFNKKAPMLAQASCRVGAARLAEELCRHLGDYVVTFTNSGAETIEAALKHCIMERQRSLFWAVREGFHGKSLGAIKLTWSYCEPFADLGPRVRFLDPQEPNSWREAEPEIENVAGVFIEPIFGEGGIKVLPKPFIEWVTTICRRSNVPLVVDEIQSGMGRTGSFLASDALGITPDYVCLSKALGGGLAKIGALLVKRDRFVEDFSVQHTSTFAEDDFSCSIALEALRIFDRDAIPAKCASMGEFLLSELAAVRDRFPQQIKEVRGKGLMVGLELQDQSDSRSYLLRMFSQQKHLGYVAAAYLLNMHNIRIAPTLSSPFTLRIEPSAYINIEDLRPFIRAITMLVEALRANDVAHLIGFHIGSKRKAVVDYSEAPRLYRRERPRSPRRVAFLGHLLSDEQLTVLEPSLSVFDTNELKACLEKLARLGNPTIIDQINVTSRMGEKVHLSFIGLPLTARQIVNAMENHDSKWIMEKIETATEMARDEGCQVIGFGGYTSIVSGNCRRLKTNGIRKTTGNSLTVGMGVEAMNQAAKLMGLELARSKLAVVGATGNIASTYAALMAPFVAEVNLIVHNLASVKLQSVLKRIRDAAPQTCVKVFDNLEAVSTSRLIISATNSPEPLIYPENLATGPVVICDISLPPNVAPEVKTERPDVLVLQGGVVLLPDNDDFSVGGIPLPTGHTFACIGETLLMGLESTFPGSSGRITIDGVQQAMRIAEKHGFRLGAFSINSPLSAVFRSTQSPDEFVNTL